MLHFVLLLWISLLKLQSSSCEEDKRNSLISALEKAVTFLNDKYDQINIDAVLGYSVMEAYLEATQEKLHSKSELSAERERITLMKEKLLAFVEKANPEAAKQAPDLYKGSSNRNEDRVQVAKRSKRSEKIVEGDCSSHNTAVAVGALAGFLYYNF
ncbi:UPF0764 protein C16orf89 homolog [Liasis olivaceus]